MKKFNLVALVVSAMTLMSCATSVGDSPAKEVVADTAVTEITLDKPTMSLVVGSEDTLVSTTAPETATVKIVTYESSNLLVATVDATGKVKAISAGVANIVAASVENAEVTATAVVTVVASADVVTPPSVIADTKAISEIGYTIDFAGNSTGKAIDKLTLSDKTSYKRFWLVKDGKDYIVDATGTIVENSSKVMTAMWISDTVGWAVFVEDTSAGAHDGWYITKW